MSVAHSKKLSSVGIIGLMLSIMEVATRTPWSFMLSHQNFDAQDDTVEYAFASATPQMRRWVGGRNAKRLFAQSVSLKSEPFEATVVDFVKNWVYDKTGMLRKRVENFIGRSYTHWDKLATEVLLLGESTYTYDGAYFFSASHSTGDSGTIKNLLTSSEISALNVSSTSAVTTLEAADIIFGLLAYFQTFKDDVGEPIHEDLSSMMVMVPSVHYGAFASAASAKTVTNGTITRDNPLAVMPDLNIVVKANTRLTDATKIYAFALNGDPAFILQQQGPVKMSSKAEGSDFEHDTDQWEFGMQASRTVGLFCWQAAIKATLS